MKKYYLFNSKIHTYYDEPEPTVPPTVPPPPPPPAPVTFTQAQVDKMMAEHRKGLQTQNAELVKQLEELRQSANLTQQQRDELDARINNLTQQHLTTEQKLKAQVEATEKKYKADTENLTNESRKWKGNYEKLLVTNEILKGAMQYKAAKDTQLLAMLLPNAKVVEEVDDKGQPTGNFVAKLPTTVIDPKSKQKVTLELPIVEAIGKMRDDPDNANLFLIDGKPGFGGSGNAPTGSGSGEVDWSKLTPAQHRAKRKELGLDKR